MATVNDMLVCPKCHKKMLGKSVRPTFGKEYFCHYDHEYFGANELVNKWGYDAGDLFPPFPVTYADYKNSPLTNRHLMPIYSKYYSEFVGGEPYWANLAEYQDAQAMVGRMLLNIPEIDDYADLLNTQEAALGIGVQ